MILKLSSLDATLLDVTLLRLTHLSLVSSIEEHQGVLAGFTAVVVDCGTILFPGQEAEEVEFDLLTRLDLDLPWAGDGSNGHAVSDLEREVATGSFHGHVTRLNALATGPFGNYKYRRAKRLIQDHVSIKKNMNLESTIVLNFSSLARSELSVSIKTFSKVETFNLKRYKKYVELSVDF